MPCGKCCGSGTMLALASRLTCQQSSMLTYTYPASFIPDLTTASAMLLIMSSLTLQANLFHEFQPIGGVSARCADGAMFSCAIRAGTNIMTNIITNDERKNNDAATRCFVFIDTFYQNRSRIRHFVSAHLIPSTLFRCSKGRSRRKTFTI